MKLMISRYWPLSAASFCAWRRTSKLASSVDRPGTVGALEAVEEEEAVDGRRSLIDLGG